MRFGRTYYVSRVSARYSFGSLPTCWHEIRGKTITTRSAPPSCCINGVILFLRNLHSFRATAAALPTEEGSDSKPKQLLPVALWQARGDPFTEVFYLPQYPIRHHGLITGSPGPDRYYSTQQTTRLRLALRARLRNCVTFKVFFYCQ